MKISTLIFALYLLALTVYPCSDSNTCADQKADGRTTVELAQHDHSEDEADACSPFCICSCCSVTFRLTTAEVTLKETAHHTLHIIAYTVRPLLSSSYTIWQPPRLG